MARQALVIGSQTYGLKGVVSDAKRMSAMLEARGFEVDLRIGRDAARDGILEGYYRLIGSCSPGDAAVVYFSGHGGRVPDPACLADGLPRLSSHEQFIVPEDFQASREGDFRGITSFELSALQARLTTLTRNVTVILDCCYASCMSRASGVRSKALPDVPHAWIASHLEDARTRAVASAAFHVEGNPHAVRMVAAGLNQPAFEYPAAPGRWAGAMTDALLSALDEVGDRPVAWELLGRRVRERVMAMLPFQRPEMEGPVHRVALGTGDERASRGLSYFMDNRRHFLRGGSLHGVIVGDEYLVMPFPSSEPDAARGLARANVLQVDAGTCEVCLEPNDGVHEISPGSPAFLVRSAGRKRSIQIFEDGAERTLGEALKSRLEESLLVCPAMQLEQNPLLAYVRLGASSIELQDRDGFRVAYPFGAEMGAVERVVQAVEMLARAQALRELESGPGAEALEAVARVEWGVVREGAPQRLSGAPRQLRSGERVYVRLVNDGTEPLYASVFDVGLVGRITLLNRAQPSGVLVEPNREVWLGMRHARELEGFELHWPDAVPPDAPGLESFVVILTDRPQDLRLLETGGIRHRVFSPKYRLQSLLEQLAWGGGRDLKLLAGEAPVRYAVHHLEFLLEAPGRLGPA